MLAWAVRIGRGSDSKAESRDSGMNCQMIRVRDEKIKDDISEATSRMNPPIIHVLQLNLVKDIYFFFN